MNERPVILVVDDESNNVELLEAQLSPLGYEVLTAANGPDALQKLKDNPIDLVLLDIMMPGMSGFEVTRRIRQDPKNRLLPVVLITALREVEDRIQGIEAGSDDFISKPFDKSEVLARVRMLLRMNYYRSQLDEKNKFESVIHGMGDGVVVCDPNWTISEINLSAQRQLNLAAGKNRSLLDVLDNGYVVSLRRERLIDNNVPHKRFDVVRRETRQFQPLYLETYLDILKDPAGEVVSIVLVLRDVTEQREDARQKHDFLTMISHKVRTPSTVALSGIASLKDGLAGPLNQKQLELMTVVEKSYRRFIDLILRIINFVIIDAEEKEPVAEFNLCDALEALRARCLKMVGDKKIDFSLDCPDHQMALFLNKGHFDLMMNNLIDNAIKFCNKDTIRVDLSARLEAGTVKISLADNGPGIPSEELGKIFQPFYQVENDITGQVEGPGLGLALVKKLIDDWGGRIEVTSQLDQGTKFLISLPK